MAPTPKPVIPGTRYGKFVALREGEAYWTPDGRYRRRQAEVHCDECGQDTILRLDHLRNGDAICEYCSGKTPLPRSGPSIASGLAGLFGFGRSPIVQVPTMGVQPPRPVVTSPYMPKASTPAYVAPTAPGLGRGKASRDPKWAAFAYMDMCEVPNVHKDARFFADRDFFVRTVMALPGYGLGMKLVPIRLHMGYAPGNLQWVPKSDS